MHDAAGKALELRLEFPDGLPEMPEFEPGIRRAPNRGQVLNDKEVVLALKNALRYIPESSRTRCATSPRSTTKSSPPSSSRNTRSTDASTAIASVRKENSTANPSTNIRASASKVKPSR